MATHPLPNEYFIVGVFAPAGPELLRAYTCVACGLRSATWTTFRTHRTVCVGLQRAARVAGAPDALLALGRVEARDPPAGGPALEPTPARPAPPPVGRTESRGGPARSVRQASQRPDAGGSRP